MESSPLSCLVDLCDRCHLLRSSYRCDAAFAAVRIDPGNKAALDYLNWASRHSDWLIRDVAMEKLEKLRDSPKSAR